jgi:hypothetical protein
MLRKCVSAAFILVVCVSFTLADEIRAVITKVDGNKVTFAEVKGGGRGKGKVEKGEPKTLPVTASVKVVKSKFDPDTKKTVAGDPIENGLKNEMFSKIDAEKGLQATIVTDSDNKNITEIRVGGRGGRRGKQ